MAISSTSDFVAKFHNLDGDLIGERKKSLFILLKTASQNLTAQDIDVAIDNLDPKTYQEKLFHIETLVYFKKISHLIEVLKSCNRDHIKIVMRQKWFMKEAFKDMSPAQLVNEFFPSVSYSTRLKLLWRIPQHWSEEKNDDLFDHVQKRYGLYIALGTLHTCSVSKLFSILQEYEVTLNAVQIIYCLNKSKDLIKFYLDRYYDLHSRAYADRCLLNLLASKYPELFLELEAANKINSPRLEYAASKKLIENSKAEVVGEPDRFVNILNIRALVKYLGSDLKGFILKIVPRKFNNLNSNCSYHKILKKVSKNQRWKLLIEILSSVFPDKHIEELLKISDSSIIELNPNRDTIFKWAQINYKITGDDNFLQYYPTSVSIPLIKEKINVTSDVGRRLALLRILISTCAQNKDMKSLDKVLDYIGSRHKNENSEVYKKVIMFVYEKFDDTDFSKNHWTFFSQQMILIRTVSHIDFYDCKYIMQGVLEYFCANDKDIFNAMLPDYVKHACDFWCHFRIYSKNYELEREIFIECLKLVCQIVTTEHKNYFYILKTVIDDFVSLCERGPSCTMNIAEFPLLVSAIVTACNKKENLTEHEQIFIKYGVLYNISCPQYALNEIRIFEVLSTLHKAESQSLIDIHLNIIRKKEISDLEKKIMLFSFENLNIDSWYLDDIIRWALNRHPRLFATNFKNVLPKLTKNYYDKVVKHYSHLGLDRIICEYIQDTWAQKDIKQQQEELKILLDLLSNEQIVAFVEKNLNSDVANIDDIEYVKLQKVRILFTELLRTVADPIYFLPVISTFLKDDDYLSSSLTSLYSLLSRSPENLIPHHLKVLSQQTPSIHKHIIYITFLFLNHEFIVNTFNNKSLYLDYNALEKALCLAGLKYFSKNGSDGIFAIVKRCMSTIQKYDKVILCTAVRIAVPRRYRAEYVELWWKVLENIEENEKIYIYFDKLLTRTFDRDVMVSLSSDFVCKVFTRYFSEQSKNRLTNIDLFTILCLVYREDRRSDDLKTVFDVLKSLNRKHIKEFCQKFTDRDVELTMINDFIEQWKNNFSLIDTLDEFIALNIMLRRINADHVSFAKSVVDYLEQLIVELGPAVFEIFKTNFKRHVDKQTKRYRYQLLHSMLKHKASSTNCVFVLGLVEPVGDEEDDDIRFLYQNILHICRFVADPIVQCYYEMYLDTASSIKK